METEVNVTEDAGSAELTVAFSNPPLDVHIQVIGLQLTLSATIADGTAGMHSI